MTAFARLFLCLLALSASALAQQLRIDAPAGRWVAPGEFVTLVFRIDGPEGLALDGEVTSALDWRVLRQPGSFELDGGTAEPLAITLAVPSDAEATLTDTVTLRLSSDSGDATASTALTVGEVIDLELQVPDTVLLDSAGITAVAPNRGNVPAEADLLLLQQGSEVARTSLTLMPGVAEIVALPLDDEGFYELRLVAGERRVSRTVRALRFGVPPPAPLALRADIGASLDSSGRWNVNLTLEGALSDFVAVDARLDSDLERSFLTLSDEEQRQTLHLGGDPPSPFRLRLPTTPGLVIVSEQEPWGTAFAGGWSLDSGPAAYAAFRYGEDGAEVAAAAGYAERAPLAAARGRFDLPASTFAVTLDGIIGYRATQLDASAGVDARRLSDRARAGLDLLLRDALGDRARFEVRARASDRLTNLYGDVVVAIGPDSEGSWRVGGDLELPTGLPGQLRGLLQVGAPSSFAVARYAIDLGSGWRSQSSLGVLGDRDGFGLSAASLWLVGSGPGNGAQLGFDLTYRPASGRVDGRVDGRYQTEIDALALLASAGWDLTEQALAIGASAAWRGGDWQVQLDLDGGYLYSGETDPLRIEVGLQGSYGIDLGPSPALTDLAGGRDLGRLEGRLEADGFPVAGAVIAVGRFRLRTDDDGRFEADLEPGVYRLRLDVATLPIEVRPAGAAEQTVEVRLRETIEVAFPLQRTVSVQGRVLVDSDGDGVADDPAVGVRARLVLIEANGVIRSLETDGDGGFEARGVTPGVLELRLIEQPFGSSAVGPTDLVVEAQAGERIEALFLSRPAEAVAQTFGAGLRISGIDIAPRTAPPGAAPLLRISVRGDPDRVSVEGPEGTVELTRVERLWIGRYPIPDDAAAGSIAVLIVAEGGGERSERRANLLIDPDAPPFEATASSPVEPGGTLAIEVDTYLATASILARAAEAGSVALRELSPGRWVGELAIPAELADGVFELTVEVERPDGRRFEQTLRFRVMIDGNGS
jgi:hypothetical protein